MACWAGVLRASGDDQDSEYTQTDADGIPLSVTNPEKKALSPSELDAIRADEARAARNRDWLLRSYEEQMHARDSSSGQSTNLYYQLSSNKELARLSGLPALGYDEDNASMSASAPRSEQHPNGGSSNANNASVPSARSTHLPSSLLKPYLLSLGTPDASQHSYLSPLATAIPMSPSGDSLKPRPPTPPSVENPDAGDLESPGMTAAEKNPMDTDLSLDVLPGESVADAETRRENNTSLDLPVAMNADQLHKAQAASLSAPSPLRAAPVTEPVKVKPVPIDDSDAPTPASKLTPISPVRSPISNPYDILNH
jgi:hypothetical protein